MLKRKMTILLVGPMCISFVSGFSTVICHGADGHVALKLPVHNHCECPETGHNGGQNNAGATIGFSADHEHCKDTVVAPNVLPIRKNVKPSTLKIFIAKLTPKPILAYTPSFLSRFATQSGELSSFHTPLRSIILLA